MKGSTIALAFRGFHRHHDAVVEGLRAYAAQHSLAWRTVLLDTSGGGRREAIDWARRGIALPHLDGQITWGPPALADDHGLPTIIIRGSQATASDAPMQTIVGTDDAAIGRLAAEHAHAAGYRQGAVLWPGGSAATDRLSAYLEHCQALGMLTAVWRAPADCADLQAHQLAWLQARGEAVALFFHQDRAALYWRDLLTTRGMQVPEDFGLIGVDNCEACKADTPTLTSIELPYRHMGHCAARALHQMLSGNPSEAGIAVPPLRLVARESTRRPPTRLVARALRRMERGVRAPLSVEALAAKLGVSANTLRRACKRDLQASPKQVQLQFRLQRAADLLVESDRSLDHIAKATGFCDTTALITAFRKHYGLPPGRFREMGGQVV